jgi:hypothetical protein
MSCELEHNNPHKDMNLLIRVQKVFTNVLVNQYAFTEYQHSA